MVEFDTDVIVIGAGPAGASLAGYLRKAGATACVLEREVFPRFHIGESLLTMSIPRIASLGLDLSKAPYAKHKPGAYFHHDDSGENLRIDFSHALSGSFPYAYQVERQYFDHDLAECARALGADVRYGVEVKGWSEDQRGVSVTGEFGSLRGRYMIDATGQHAIFGRRRRTMDALDRFGQCASFSTFGNVSSEFAQRHVGNGDITILLIDGGWVWLIPLPEGRVSVGVVEKSPKAGTTAEDVLLGTLAQSPFLAPFFAGAERIAPIRRITNYSYYNLEPNTARCGTVGDACAFLDPIFSSGVTVAIATAELLAGEIVAALRGDRELRLDEYKRTCQKGYVTFDRLIERFYRPDWVRNVFFASNREDRLVREFTSILAGDVWRDDNGIQQMLINARAPGRKLAGKSS